MTTSLELNLLLAEKKYEQAWKEALLQPEDSFLRWDVAFVAGAFLFPEKKTALAEEIVKRASHPLFFISIQQAYDRLVKNLDTVERKREISFYLPSTKAWGPEEFLLAKEEEKYLIKLTEALAKKYFLTVYSHPLDKSLLRFPTANPQYKPLSSYLTDRPAEIAFVKSEDISVLSRAEKTYTWTDLFAAQNISIESFIDFPVIKKKRNFYSVATFLAEESGIDWILSQYGQARSQYSALSLYVFTPLTGNKLNKLTQQAGNIQVILSTSLEPSLGKYSFYLTSSEQGYLYHLARASGCLISGNLLSSLNKYSAWSEEAREKERKPSGYSSWSKVEEVFEQWKNKLN